MNASIAPTPYLILDAAFARLLSAERRRMAPLLTRPVAVPVAAGSGGPWRARDLVLLAALGFFLASLLLGAAFA